MKNSIKCIIFDWGRTLFDNENNKLFSDSFEVVRYLKNKGYTLTLSSIVTTGDIEGRFKLLQKSGLKKYFDLALYHNADKLSLLKNILGNVMVAPKNTCIIDDNLLRLTYPIKIGCLTIWIKRGKFSSIKPDKNTGKPTFIIKNLLELKWIL